MPDRVPIWNTAQDLAQPQHSQAVLFARRAAEALRLPWRLPAAAPAPPHPAQAGRVEGPGADDGAPKPKAFPETSQPRVAPCEIEGLFDDEPTKSKAISEAPQPRATPYETDGLFDEPPAVPLHWPSDAEISAAYPLAAPYVVAVRNRRRDKRWSMPSGEVVKDRDPLPEDFLPPAEALRMCEIGDPLAELGSTINSP